MSEQNRLNDHWHSTTLCWGSEKLWELAMSIPVEYRFDFLRMVSLFAVEWMKDVRMLPDYFAGDYERLRRLVTFCDNPHEDELPFDWRKWRPKV